MIFAKITDRQPNKSPLVSLTFDIEGLQQLQLTLHRALNTWADRAPEDIRALCDRIATFLAEEKANEIQPLSTARPSGSFASTDN